MHPRPSPPTTLEPLALHPIVAEGAAYLPQVRTKVKVQSSTDCLSYCTNTRTMFFFCFLFVYRVSSIRCRNYFISLGSRQIAVTTEICQQLGLIDAGSSMCSLSVLLSAVKTSLRPQSRCYYSRVTFFSLRASDCAATIWGQHLNRRIRHVEIELWYIWHRMVLWSTCAALQHNPVLCDEWFDGLFPSTVEYSYKCYWIVLLVSFFLPPPSCWTYWCSITTKNFMGYVSRSLVSCVVCWKRSHFTHVFTQLHTYTCVVVFCLN